MHSISSKKRLLGEKKENCIFKHEPIGIERLGALGKQDGFMVKTLSDFYLFNFLFTVATQ